MKNMLMCGALAVLLSGCASSSVVVGKVRPAIDPAMVKLYLEPPKAYERVALLEASSKSSWAVSDQGKMNAVIDGLKKEAAKVGANGVLLSQTSTQQSGGTIIVPLATGGVMGVPSSIENKSGNGFAIFVTEE